MTSRDKVLDLIGCTTLAVLALWLTRRNGTDSLEGVIFLAAWCFYATAAGLAASALGRQWVQRRRIRREIDRQADARARQWLVPPTVEDHYSGPRKIVKSGDGEAIVATHNGRDYEVHNHGPHEGRGLDCPEYTTKGGRLRGACIVVAEIARAYGMEADAEAVEHLARRDPHVRDVHQAHHEGRLETVEPEDLP